jgi:PD-(D/E)XK endonuclease
MVSLAKGNAAEAAVLNALVQRGFNVLVPFGEGQPYDLGVHVPGGEFLRVQCKNARWDRGCVVFNSRTTDHGRGRRSYLGLADAFGVFEPSTAAVYLVPVADAPGFEGRLRVRPTRNNQRLRVRHAAQYEIDRWTPETLAAIARNERPSRPQLALSA